MGYMVTLCICDLWFIMHMGFMYDHNNYVGYMVYCATESVIILCIWDL